MIETFRKYIRLALALVWTLTMFTLRVCGMPLAWVSPSAERRFRRAVFRTYARGLLRVTGVRVKVRGAAPEPPFYMVTNHLTFFDIFVLASQLGCVFVARADLAKWPVFGFICSQMQTIYIDRERLKDTVRVNQQIQDRMEKGYGVVVFAESKCSEDDVVLPFKPALLESAVQLGLSVHYASLNYVTPEGFPPAAECVFWKGETAFFEHYFDVARLPYVDASLTFGAEPMTGACRKALAIELHTAVSEQYVAAK